MADKTIHVIGKSGAVDLTEHVDATKIVFTDCHITDLNVSGLANLQALDLTNVGKKSLTSINTENCTLLGTINAKDCRLLSSVSGLMTCDSLQLLDLENCVSLSALILRGSGPTTLNLKGCSALARADVSNLTNNDGIVTLNIEGCTLMFGDYGVLDLSNINLVNLTVKNIAGLVTLTVPAKLTGLDLTGTGVTTLTCNAGTFANFTGVSSLATLTITEDSTTSINLSGLSTITNLTITSCTSLTTLDITGLSITALDLTGTALTTLTCNTGLIAGLTSVATLVSLTIKDDTATSLDVTALTTLTSLDVTNATSLTSLNMSGLTLVSLNGLSSLTLLQTLNLSGCSTYNGTLPTLTALQTLNLSGCTAFNPTLGTLDLAGCTALVSFDMNNTSNGVTILHFDNLNNLTTIDVSNCTNVAKLEADLCTALSSLSMTGMTGLNYLNIGGTSLTTLDLSGAGSALTGSARWYSVYNNASMTTITYNQQSGNSDDEYLFNDNALTEAGVDAILDWFYANSGSVWYINLELHNAMSGTNAPPSPTGASEADWLRTQLEWTVSIAEGGN